jgi:hypothetical protein
MWAIPSTLPRSAAARSDSSDESGTDGRRALEREDSCSCSSWEREGFTAADSAALQSRIDESEEQTNAEQRRERKR